MKDITLRRIREIDTSVTYAVVRAGSLEAMQAKAGEMSGQVGVVCRSACYQWTRVDYERACRLILEHFPETHFTIGKVEYQIVITL